MINRRAFLGLVSISLALSESRHAFAAAPKRGWRPIKGTPSAAFGKVAGRASSLGGFSEKANILEVPGDGYDVLLPRIVGIINTLEDQSVAVPPERRAELLEALDEATELLGALAAAERSAPSEEIEKALRRYKYEDLRDGYLANFDRCEVRNDRLNDVAWYVSTVQIPKNKAQYEEVEKKLAIPWYFVGIIHSLEAGFNFSAHLHNGDPLRHRTVQVPPGRPRIWNPPTDWASSAADALTMQNLNNQPDWSISRMLYRLEGYNGFGSRAHGVDTPYLWSFSNIYSKGKYVKDGAWSPSAVSLQCGGAVILKALITKGLVQAPPR